MSQKLLTAICFFNPKLSAAPLKYRNINNVEKFVAFAAGKGVMYVNFYAKESKQFIQRVWIEESK